MNVGVDVAPLVQDARRDGAAHPGSAAARSTARRPDRAAALLGRRGPAVAVVRDVLWYPLGLPRQARERLDVLHCTIFRAPDRSRVPVVLTVHDLAVLRQPEVFPAWTG